MLDIDRFKSQLLDSGKINPERLAEAEAYSSEKGVSLPEALATNLVLGFADLGQCCSELTGLPYVPLMPKPPSEVALQLISPQCAARWKIFPTGYDAREDVLSFAIHDPHQQAKVEALYRFFMQPHGLDFSIAPDVEIARACKRHLGFLSAEDAAAAAPRLDSNAIPALAPEPPKATVASEPEKQGTPRRERSRKKAEPSYVEMNRALISAVTLIVRSKLGESPQSIHALRTRVRYCQMLAARMELTRVQTDALILAAWLCGLEGEPDLVRQLTTPFALEEILHAESDKSKRLQRIESRILSLVRAYEEVCSKVPDSKRDVARVRRELQLKWSSSPRHQELLEPFLQILVDEEFLEHHAGEDGRILIVDAEEEVTCNLVPALERVGYSAAAVPNAEAAHATLENYVPDLVVVDLGHESTNGLRLIESLKYGGRTQGIGILALVGDDADTLAAESLRAGADDYLSKPVNLEILLLKVSASIGGERGDADGDGVSGSLEEMGFTDMIQILCAGGKNLEIVLKEQEEEGFVYVQDGKVVHAKVNQLEGEQAFYALMRWQSGRFSTRPCAEFPDCSISVSTMSLLMEGSRQADEATAPA